MRQNGLRARFGYRKPRFRSGKPACVAPNQLAQEFTAARPDQLWVADISVLQQHGGMLSMS
jgi:putative transposase